MVFSFLAKNRLINFVGVISLLSCFSCQSLNQMTKLNQIKLSQNQLNPLIIDKNYLEQSAVLNYLKAEAAFFENDSTAALKYLKTARLFAPQSSHFQKKTAELYEKEDLTALAIDEYKNLIKKTKNKFFIEKLINLYAGQQLNAQALEQNDLLLKQAPYNFQLNFKKAVLLSQLENWSEALKALKKAENKTLSLEEAIQSLLFRAYIFAKQNKKEKSIKIFDQIKQLDFPEEKLVLKTAEFYKNFSAQKARAYLEDFQQKKRITAKTASFLLNEALSSKNWKKAQYHMRQLKDLGELTEQHYFYKALFFTKEKQYNRASLYLKDLIAKTPQNGHYNYLLALNYENDNQWGKAERIYQKVSSRSPYFLAAHLQLAQLWQKQGKYKKSFKLLNRLAFKDPTSPQATLMYAESLWRTGSKKQALIILTKALRYHPKHLDILLLRGFYFKQSGDLNLALADMNQILEIRPSHKEALKITSSLQSSAD